MRWRWWRIRRRRPRTGLPSPMVGHCASPGRGRGPRGGWVGEVGAGSPRLQRLLEGSPSYLASEMAMVVYQTATSTHRPPGLHGTALRPPGDGVCMFWSVLGPPEGAVRAMAMTLDFTGGFLRHPAHLQLIPCHPCRAAPAVLLLWVAKSSPGGRVRVSESAVCCCGCAEWSPAMSTSGGDVELRVQAGRR